MGSGHGYQAVLDSDPHSLSGEFAGCTAWREAQVEPSGLPKLRRQSWESREAVEAEVVGISAREERNEVGGKGKEGRRKRTECTYGH